MIQYGTGHRSIKRHRGIKLNFFDVDSEVCNLDAEEERILASFTRRLIEIAAVAGARGSAPSPTAALNAMRLPAIALDRTGLSPR
jgi:hypothetical protein